MDKDFDDYQEYLFVSGLADEDRQTNNDGCFKTLFQGALIYVVVIVAAFVLVMALIALTGII